MTNPSLISLASILLLSHLTSAATVYNVVDHGADRTGRRGSTKAFMTAWNLACNTRGQVIVRVPPGKFLLGAILFKGPCRSSNIKFSNAATIVATGGFRHGGAKHWIHFNNIVGLSITGGVLDGRGARLWACKLAGRGCPLGATNLSISRCNKVAVTKVTSVNSQLFHILVHGCNDVTMKAMVILSPGDSPNTDGIHFQHSNRILMYAASIRVGDDCISIGEGTSNLYVERISCGPGHGISIGSLANKRSEPGVRDITVKSAVLTGTQNGLRIKSWARPSNGFVSRVLFQDIVMRNVRNPIFIDQNYCPFVTGCPRQNSGIRISDVTFNHVKGTSSSEVAVKFDCSPSNPCTGITLKGVQLSHKDQPAVSYCRNARGKASGYVNPPSCLV